MLNYVQNNYILAICFEHILFCRVYMSLFGARSSFMPMYWKLDPRSHFGVRSLILARTLVIEAWSHPYASYISHILYVTYLIMYDTVICYCCLLVGRSCLTLGA
jgi:hypothetical protein